MTFAHPNDREEGFTGAFNRASWERVFAWLPVRLTEYPRQRVWLKWIEVKHYGAFGIPQFAARLAVTERELRAEMVDCMVRERIIRERLGDWYGARSSDIPASATEGESAAHKGDAQ